MTKIKVAQDIELRLLEEKDRFELFDTVDANRLHLRKWMSWVDLATNPGIYLSVIKEWREDADKAEALQLGIFYKEALVGMTGFNQLDEQQGRAQIGYWISKDAEGKAVARRSVEGLINYGFDTLNLNRIEIICGEKNIRSRKIPEALGFVQEGIMAEYEFLYDHYHDCVLYRLLKKERNVQECNKT